MKGRRIRFSVAIMLLLLATMGFQVAANVVAGFEIDGDLYPNQGGIDWTSVILDNPVDGDWADGPGILIRDGSSGPKNVLPELNTFVTGGKFDAPEDWDIGAGNVPAQNDLTNIYAYPIFDVDVDGDGIDNHTFMAMGMERLKKQGTFDLDFEYNQVPWDGSDGSLVRTDGDIAVGFELSGNPSDPDADLVIVILVFKPGNPTCTGYESVYGGGWCVVVSGTGQTLNPAYGYATMNGVAVAPGPWGSFDSSGAALGPGVQIQPFFFAEAAIDLTALGLEVGCPGFGSVHAKSRSSLEISADMKDLAGPRSLPIECSIDGYKYKDVDGDGAAPPETGDVALADWTIKLYSVGNDGVVGGGDDVLVATTTTDANGYYIFGGLSDGTYYVVEECPVGWAQTYPAPSNGCGSGIHSGIVITGANKNQGPFNFGHAQGSIIILKQDEDGVALPGAGFTFDPDPFGGSSPVEILDGDPEDQADGDDGVLCIDGVALGSYDVTETTIPDGYAGDPDTAVVVVDSSGTCADRLAGAYTPDATFVNELGSIIIVKNAKDASAQGGVALLGGAGFTFDPDPVDGVGTLEIDDESAFDQASGIDGVLCVDDVKLGSYDVSETQVPAGYEGDPDTEIVLVSSGDSCAERLAGTYTADATFTNIPYSEIEVIFRSLNGPGVTVATITCQDENGNVLTLSSGTDDADEVFTDLLPGTYDCQIFIDP